MFYSQVILAKKGPLAKVWLAAHWGDKKLARPQIFATDISQSCVDIMNPTVPLALRLSGHLLLGVVRIYSRKVKYVLNDCTEAMLKLQMAFSKPQRGSKDAGDTQLLTTEDGHQQLVANFGEFDRVHVVEGFCLPLPEDNEWILADERKELPEDAFIQKPGRDSGLLLLPGTQQSQNGDSLMDTEEEEEQWAPFDPDNEDDDEDEELREGLPNNSRVSDIEVVRAANDSMLSEDPTVRMSDVDKESTPGTGGPTTPSLMNMNLKTEPREENYDFGNVPFGEDDSEDETPGPADLDPKAFQTPGGQSLPLDGDTPVGGLNLNLGDAAGLALDDETPDSRLLQAGGAAAVEETPGSATKTPGKRKRRRKRRKVVIDNHSTELTNEAIRKMLSNTEDLVFPQPHPGRIWDEANNINHSHKDYVALVLEDRARHEQEHSTSASGRSRGKQQQLPSKAASEDEDLLILTRPFLQDGGQNLHPSLAKLWKDNYWKALLEACPYKRQQEEEEEEEADDIEEVRRAKNNDDDNSSRATQQSDLDIGTSDNKGDTPLQQQQQQQTGGDDNDMDFPVAVDDEEDDQDFDVPVPDFDDLDDEETRKRKRDEGEGSDDILDLGMVNDMVLDSDDDDEDNSDNEDGENADNRPATSTSSTKWHKHTVRVYNHLKKVLRDPGAEDADAEKPDSVDFHELTKHVKTRRNASSVFFEMLQLKTWDFIELNQDDAYGEINISPGVRFGESAPKS